MLVFQDRGPNLCDGISRRDWLRLAVYPRLVSVCPTCCSRVATQPLHQAYPIP